MKSCKMCWLVSLLLAIGLGVMAYLFLIRGNVTQSADGRTAIILEGIERDLVLEEMRGFLVSVQAITQAVADDDMPAVAENAKAAGMAAAGGVPLSLMSKLPLEFKTLGLATHEAFDEIAREAEDLGEGKVVLEKLSDLLNNCTACHATYRLEAAQNGKN